MLPSSTRGFALHTGSTCLRLKSQLQMCLVVQRKTGECFGLNGLIFLGSILLWDYGLSPGMQWLLRAVGSTAGLTSGILHFPDPNADVA